MIESSLYAHLDAARAAPKPTPLTPSNSVLRRVAARVGPTRRMRVDALAPRDRVTDEKSRQSTLLCPASASPQSLAVATPGREPTFTVVIAMTNARFCPGARRAAIQ